MELAFWAALVVIVYVYAGYPLLLWVARLLVRRPVRKRCWEPTVSLIIAAHNERERIGAKIENCLMLDYPRNKLQIIVSLDGSNDGTDAIVRKYALHGVELVRSRRHRGKAAALNRAVRRARGDVLVFADARQMFDPAAIRQLVTNLADDGVGAVSGELVLLENDHDASSGEIGMYWRYEKRIRMLESQLHSVAGATGAIYAIKRELYRDLPEDTILDDVEVPMRILLQGKRVVFEPAARAYDRVSCCAAAEYGRKVRTLMGNYQLLAHMPQLLLPWRNPVFVQFVSHKLGRLLVPYCMIALFVLNLFLAGGFYFATLILQSAFYLSAAAGRRVSALRIPYTFVLMNTAVVVGLFYFVAGRRDVWLKYRNHKHEHASDRRRTQVARAA